MQEGLSEYIQKNFPDFWNDIHIRFELGDPFENGSDGRIAQVIQRVATLFEEIFSEQDVIHLYIKDWESEDNTSGYLYDLLKQHRIDETNSLLQVEDVNDEGNTINTMRPFSVKTLSGIFSSIPYRDILTGIANYEQGRMPSIGQRVYFINMKKDIMFYMYDDRGCIIFAKDKEKLQGLYTKYNDWLADYWRECFDNLYK